VRFCRWHNTGDGGDLEFVAKQRHWSAPAPPSCCASCRAHRPRCCAGCRRRGGGTLTTLGAGAARGTRASGTGWRPMTSGSSAARPTGREPSPSPRDTGDVGGAVDQSGSVVASQLTGWGLFMLCACRRIAVIGLRVGRPATRFSPLRPPGAGRASGYAQMAPFGHAGRLRALTAIRRIALPQRRR
jgi:hypothetical protein